MNALSRAARPLGLLLLGGLLLLPGLGSFGLWEPHELRGADAAHAVFERATAADSAARGVATAPALRPPTPPLQTWAIALGMRVFGAHELGARLPLALCGLLGLLLAYRFASRLFGSDAGLAAGFVLLTTPAFVFASRQLAGEIVADVAALTALGGLAAYLWPRDGQRRVADLALGALGLVAGFLARGALLGSAFPLVVLTIALIGQRQTLGAGERRVVLPALLGAVLLAAAAIGALLSALGGGPILLYGALPHAWASPATFDVALENLGYGTFPWFALLPLALAGFAWLQRDDDTAPASDATAREAAAALVLLLGVVLGYLVAALWSPFFGPLRYPALPWACMAIGVWAARTWREGLRQPLWGVIAASVLLVLHQDFFLRPATLAFSFLEQPPPFPAGVDIRLATRLFGIGSAALCLLALSPLFDAWPRLAAPGARIARSAGLALAALALAFAFWCAQFLTPALSHHLSNKALFTTYQQCRRGDERLAQFGVVGRSASYYNAQALDTLNSEDELFARLARPERQFVLIPAPNLGVIHRAARQRGVAYYVLDDRSSRYLVLTNRLSAPCATDHNPLRQSVTRVRPRPQHALIANFEQQVELIGYDLPASALRGGKLPITLYFHVLGNVAPNYKLFIHFDAPDNRFHGDHEPLAGKYPTQHWLAGDFIVDRHEVELPLLTTVSGTYAIWAGFWLGEQRLKVISGPSDGANRVRIATVTVR
ncbi:MAG: glycosyltransferase family 39 protein [Proteobacteria bacterium]|nr:glycosyltransferase family 39 protein [Pseudomonadota bacterium]